MVACLVMTCTRRCARSRTATGGSIFLGVLDDGSVEGVDERRVAEVQRNLVNRVYNPNQFLLSPAVETEEVQLGGRMVVRVSVPMSASVVRFKGVAYDRMFDADRRVDTDTGCRSCTCASRTTIPSSASTPR